MDYKSNSFKSKEKEKTEKVVNKVVTKPARIRKKSELKKFADVFIQDDIAKVKDHVFNEVIIPGIKDALWDILSNGLSMLLYGERDRGRISKKTASSASFINYNSISKNRSRDREVRREPVTRNIFDYDELIFDSKGEAEIVLMGLDEILDSYQMATVADLYDLAGVSTDGNFTGNNYGWTDLSEAKVSRTRDGYYFIRLPRAMPIDRGR